MDTWDLNFNLSSSGTPLLYRAVSSWFVQVSPVVDQLVQNNQETRWWVSLLLHGNSLAWTNGFYQGPAICRR